MDWNMWLGCGKTPSFHLVVKIKMEVAPPFESRIGDCLLQIRFIFVPSAVPSVIVIIVFVLGRDNM